MAIQLAYCTGTRFSRDALLRERMRYLRFPLLHRELLA